MSTSCVCFYFISICVLFSVMLVSAVKMLAQVQKIQFNERIFSLEELSAFDGSRTSLPIYVALQGHVYDVSSAPQFYAKGGSYAFFAGRDATRAFVTGCFEFACLIPDTSGLPDVDTALASYVQLYRDKYPLIGYVELSERTVSVSTLQQAQAAEASRSAEIATAEAKAREQVISQQGSVVYAKMDA